MRPARRGRSAPLWRFLGAPLPLVTGVSFVLFGMSLVDMARTLDRAERLRQAQSFARARIAAESAAMHCVAEKGFEFERVEAGDIRVCIRKRAADWLIESRCPEGSSYWFRCVELEGAAPRAMGCDCAAVDPAVLDLVGTGQCIDESELPRVDAAATASAARAEQLPAFRIDREIALLHLEAGTEADDFVLAPAAGSATLEVPGDIIVVPGHLWIEPGTVPLRLKLARDLTIVVEGNLYVARSVAVEGPGHLCFVTVTKPGTVAFADRDGNGRWSPGDVMRQPGPFAGAIEGSGAVYFGLVGCRGSIRVDAGIVPTGELHLRVDTTVCGPLVVPHGVTISTVPPVHLVAARSWVFRTERERVPGFATIGGRRPGVLISEPRNPAALPEQALYLPPPSR